MKDVVLTEVSTRGPIPFDRFMDLALYHPQGYFGGLRLRSDRSGDFLTSPEVSDLFGETLARYVETEHRRVGDPFRLVEVGAGSGSLLRPLLSNYPVEATAVEVSPAARASIESTMPGVEVATRIPGPLRGVVLANELLDNLPMALAQRVDNRWRERWVGTEDGRLVFVDAPARPEVVDWLDRHAGPVAEGGWVEAQLAAGVWLGEVLGRLQAGSVVVIDYGDSAENLLPRRADGTLRTYRAHHLGPHPLDEPGATDITADVNFTALEAVARESGAEVVMHRQDDFLASLGLRDRLSALRHAEMEAARSGHDSERLRLRSLKTEAETLLHPRGLGDFRVLVASV